MNEAAVQDLFLSKVKEGKIPVTLFLMNGFQMRGTILEFDNFSIVLSDNGKENLIYKHAISTIQPARPVGLYIS